MAEGNRFILVDGSSYLYRAFFALPHLSTSDGLPTNAIYGFTTMLHRLINEQKPDYIVIVFDRPEPTFRHEVYQAYKAQRPDMPDSLAVQIPYIKEVIQALHIPVIEKEGYEADDIIGTLAKQAERDGANVVIITGDKDMYQLVSPTITLFDTMKDTFVNIETVREKVGIEPEKTPEVYGLAGDSADNVPGVPGIGKKTAVQLIQQFGSMEAIFSNLHKITRRKLRETLQNNREQAYLSRELVTIDTHVPIDSTWKDFTIGPINYESLRKLYKRFEFNTLLRALPGDNQKPKHYHLITTTEQAMELFARLKQQQAFALDLETTSEEPMRAEIVGISFSYKDHESFYIPVTHKNMPYQADKSTVLERLKPIAEDETIKKIGQNIKYEYIILKRHGISLKGISCDTMIASYLLNPSKHNHRLEDIAMDYLDYRMTSFKEIAGSGSKAITFDCVPIEKAKDYACEDADITFMLSHILLARLENDGFQDLYTRVELPLIEVLSHMEINGVKLDLGALKKLSEEFTERLHEKKEKILNLAGEDFNINSPQQLGKILFEKLRLPGQKKTKTGHSTDITVLSNLAKVHPLPAEILSYRTLTKLKSTYIDSMPALVNPDTGRIHTSYNQTVTATGRLSSSNPNLQNIPIRTEEGIRIREAFITNPGWKILSADYSQIELRILAHLSGDQTLIDAFLHDEDVHSRTAAEIWGVPASEVTATMRRAAKVINFGIIYGMSAYGLSRELDVEPKVAQAYIDDYFRKYRGVQNFIKRIIKQANENGFVTTLLNRRRYIPEIKAQNTASRKFAERTAINTPIQGTAADLIKVAMIRIFRKLQDKKFRAKMIMQVHDELVFEAPEEEITPLRELVKKEMESVVSMDIPLKVDINWGNNWREAH